MWHRAVFALLGIWWLLPAGAAVLTPKDSTWHFFRGYSEASYPDTAAWRLAGFDDSYWENGRSAFYYENQPGSATAYTGNTLLADMSGNYTCVFLRGYFYVSNIQDIAALQVAGLSDDGFIAWINGQEVARFNMPAGDIPYNGVSSPALGEPIPWWTNTVTDFQSFLLPGTNVLAVQAFNSSKGSSSDFIINPALYYQADLAGPVVAWTYPATNAVVRQLNSVEVGFNEPVSGVDPGDLLVNGQPATDATMVTPSSVVFSFPQPAPGVVQVAFAPGHDIRDLSNARNLFAGASWAYSLNPNAAVQGVMISEFMALNSGSQTNSVHDEFGSSPDWIELCNASGAAVNLDGWALTDDPAKPRKWVFPETWLSANAYLLVLASGRDTNVFGQLHTNFKLSSSASGYLALVDPGGNVISAFVPTYPQQYEDVSYGRDRLDPTLLGYYTNSTPGAANATIGPGFGPEVRFSRASGTSLSAFNLALSVTDTNYEIRCLLLTTNVLYGTAAVTNIPTTSSTLYTGPFTVNTTMQVRARTFPRQAGLWPGPPATASYVLLTAGVPAFSSDLPIILLHNLAGGALSSASSPLNQSVILMVFEPVNGRSSLTNPPTLVSRAGFNIRGSSTAGLPQYNLALETWDEYNQDQKVELLGLPAESDWVFYAQDSFDTSFLHNPLIHQLCRDSGRYSSRTRFAEVFLNTAGGWVNYVPAVGGNYFGLYTIEEKIKRGKQRVDIEQLEPPVTNSPAITGGYLLKIDRADANERTFYDSYLQGSIIYQDPPGLEMAGPTRQAQAAYITGYFNQFGAALWGASYTDPQIGYAAYIDVDSWIDHHIFNALTFNVDAFRLSGYFYKDRGRKIEMGPLWDFDRSFGTSNGDTRCFNPRLWRVQATGDVGTDYFGNPALLGVRWWQRLFTDPDFWQHWIDRWSELRKDVLSTNHIFAAIDDLTRQLSRAQPREAARWTYSAPRSGTVSANGYAYTFSGNYAGEVAFLKRWISDRVNFIDTNFLRAPVFSGNGGPITPGYTLTITATSVEPGTQIAYTLDGTDPRAPGGNAGQSAWWGSSPLTLTLTNNARVVARAWNPNHSNVTGGSVGGNPPISSPWSAPTAATFVVSTPALAITEIMYAPPPAASGTNDNDDFEFIELKNVGSKVLYLPGIQFTNGIEFTFTATNPITSLRAGEYLLLVKNRAAFLSRYPGVTNIAGEYSGNLANSGERLCLQGALREPILDFSFTDGWFPVTDGAGFSLVIRDESAPFWTWTNSASWRPSAAVLGSPGRADPAPPALAQVVVNEVLTHTDPPEVDSVELYNPGATATNIGGWFLTDNHQVPMEYRIPAGTTVPARGFVVLTETQFGAGTNGFALSSLGEEVYLFSGNGTSLTGYRHGFEFGPQINGVTFGRYLTSDGVEHLATEITNTLGRPNSGPKVGPVVINEVMYAPPPFGLNADTLDEYIELHNSSAQTALLFDPLHSTNAWRVGGAVDYTFPLGVSMPPFSYLLLVPFDPTFDPVRRDWFCARFNVPSNTPIYGPFQGSLANTGERLGLYMPDKPEIAPSPVAGYVPYVLVEELHYSNVLPWPTNTCETGNSLGRVNEAAFADDPANWQAGSPSPGRANQGAIGLDSDNDGLPDEWEFAHGLDWLDPNGDNGPLGDPDHDGMTNWQEYVAGTDPQDAADALRFDVASKVGNYCFLAFKTRVARLYRVEKLDTLDGQWTVLADNIAGTGGSYAIYDVLGSGSRYYRVRATWAP